MTLPFKRDREGGSISGPIEVKRMNTDGEEKPFDFMDSIVDDLLTGISKTNRKQVKSALESLCNYIMDTDAGEDQEMMDQQQ